MTEWYYADTANSRQGPITTPALLQLRQQGALGDDTLLWREGLDGWTPLRGLVHELGDAPPAQADLPADPAQAPDNPATAPVHARTSVDPATADASDHAWHPAGAEHASPAAGTEAASPYAPPVAPVVRTATVVHGGDVVDAGFLKRVAALLIDAFLLTAVYYAFMILAVVLFGLGGALSRMGSGTPDFGLGTMVLLVAVYLSWPLISVCYYVMMESSSRQATLGKMAVGIKVTGLDGARITRARALGRWASHLLNYLTLYIGYLVTLFTQRKQGLHDMVASTYVVDQWAYTDYPERQQRTLGTVATVILVIWAGLLLLGIGFVMLVGLAAAF